MRAREAEITRCMGVRAIGFRSGSETLDMTELIARLCGTHTLVRSESMEFCDYSRLLTFKDNNTLNHVYYFINEEEKSP